MRKSARFCLEWPRWAIGARSLAEAVQVALCRARHNATNAASPVMPRRGAVVIMGLVVSGVDDGWGLLDAA
jgi:hypothetical protein